MKFGVTALEEAELQYVWHEHPDSQYRRTAYWAPDGYVGYGCKITYPEVVIGGRRSGFEYDSIVLPNSGGS